MTTVFISHSADDTVDENGEKSYAARVLDAVRARLTEAGYKVFDYTTSPELRAGDDWREVLAQQLFGCDAAIVLLDARALRSVWVFREVTVLLSLKAVSPSLHILPVLLGDLSTDEVKAAKLGELTRLQFLRSQSDGPETVDSEIARVVEDIVDQFAGLADIPPEARPWVNKIGACLDGTDRQLLKSGAEALMLQGRDRDEVLVPIAGAQRLAYHLHRYGGEQVLVNAVQAMRDRCLVNGKLTWLITYLLPTWVDLTEARKVLPSPDQSGSFLVELNAVDGRTGTHYVDRATCFDDARYQREVAECPPVGSGGVEEVFAALSERLIWMVYGIEDMPLPEKFDLPEETVWFLIVTTKGVRLRIVRDAIERLQTHVPQLVVFLLTGADAGEPDQGGVVLKPLDTGKEHHALAFVNRLRKLDRTA